MKKRKPKLKRIKESVAEHEYKKLMSAVRGDESLRPNTKDDLLRAFIMHPFFKTSKASFLIPPFYDTSGNSFVNAIAAHT